MGSLGGVSALPGIFESTIFTKRWKPLQPSLFIRAPHPKTEIRADRAAIEKILAAGWVGQLKIHGHRVQLHVSADSADAPLAYNRQGQIHKKSIAPAIAAEARRLFGPAEDWNAIDAEWLKGEDKIYVFDVLKKDGRTQSRLNYQDRYRLLPTHFISPYFQILPLLTQVDQCLKALASSEPHIEGLVFKSPTTVGFADTAIIRCRKPGART